MDNRSSSHKHPRPVSDSDTADAPPCKRTTLALLDEVLSPNDIETIVKAVFLGNTFASNLSLLVSDPSDPAALDTLVMFMYQMVAGAAKYPHSEVQDRLGGDCLQILTSNRDVFDAVLTAAQAVAQGKPATHEAIRDLFRLRLQMRYACLRLYLFKAQTKVPHRMLAMAAKLSWTGESNNFPREQDR
ncbi:hypothetical protein F5146DRAFT_1145408 [Armillaria mellea]|nr:hypothetical protein F5146DRAFT_1145408 [Armillaria mellea]